MKKEQLFEAIGEIEDRILDRYRQMDQRLARQHAQKKRTLRIVAIAACLALLMGACVPVGMMIAQWGGEQSGPILPGGTSTEQESAQPGEDMTGAPDDPEPLVPGPSISLDGLQALAEMRAMIATEDEHKLAQYLLGVAGGGANDRQDLIDFVALVDGTPYPWLMQGEVSGLVYQTTNQNESFLVKVVAENGDWVLCEYMLSVSDAAAYLESIKQEFSDANLLKTPVSSADGALTLHTETRETAQDGELARIIWWGEMRGRVVRIVCGISDADAVDTAALLRELRVTKSVDVSYLYPRFDKADTVFDAFVEQPGYEIYDTINEYFGRVNNAWMNEQYQDPSAPPTICVTHQGVEYTLAYEYSLPATYSQQARHRYESTENDGPSAMIDAATLSLISLTLSYLRQAPDEGAEVLTIEQVEQVAKDFLATQVKDPEAYRISIEPWADGGAFVFFSRYVGEVRSHDYVMMQITRYGEIEFYTLNYLGAMRYAPEIPESVMQSVMASMEAMVGEDAQGTCTVKAIALTLSGQLALDCEVIATYTDANGEERGSSASVLFYLTEEYVPKEPSDGDTTQPEPEPDPSVTDSGYANMEFGAFVDPHEYVIRAASTGEFKSEQLKGQDIHWRMEDSEYYEDVTAPATRTVTYEGKEYVLYYAYSRTQSILLQKRHMYTWYNEEMELNASFDAVSGAMVTFFVRYSDELPTIENFDHETNWQMAYEWIQTLVSDPEAYERGGYTVSPGYYVEYHFTRCVGDLRTNDAIYVTFDVPTGQMYSISLGYIGALRGMEPLPESVIQSLEQMLESFMLHPDDEYTIYDLFLMPDGRLAMECHLEVHYTELTDGRETLREEEAWLLVYLTEPIQ